MHQRAAEGFVVGFLAGSHLDQRRAAQEHLGLPVHEHGVVAHARDVCAARRGVAEHQGHRGHAVCGQLGELVKGPPGRHEQVGLGGQVGAARLDQVHHRQPVDPRDLQRAQALAQRVRVHRAAPDGRVVRDDHALDPGNRADAGDHARPDGELGAPRGQRGQLQERAVRVEQQLDPLPGQQPSSVPVPLLVALPATGDGQLELFFQVLYEGELRPPVGLVGLAGRVDVRGQDRHAGFSLPGPGSGARARTGPRSSGSCPWRSWAAGQRIPRPWAP